MLQKILQFLTEVSNRGGQSKCLVSVPGFRQITQKLVPIVRQITAPFESALELLKNGTLPQISCRLNFLRRRAREYCRVFFRGHVFQKAIATFVMRAKNN